MDVQRLEPAPPLAYRVLRRHFSVAQLVAIDLIVVVVLTVARATLMPHQTPRLTGYPWRSIAWTAWLVASVGIVCRRLVPALTLALVVPLVLLDVGLRANGGPGPFYLAMALYSFAVVTSRRRSLIVALAVTGADLLATAIGGGSQVLMASVGGAAIIGFGWLASENSRASRVYAMQHAEREAEKAAAADDARQQLVSRAVADERTQIARELHDIVAHAMSVIAVRAGVARMVMDAQPDQARDALGIIETTTRRSLQEMRLLVGVLRGAEDSGAQLTPSPGLADLPRLVSDVELAGVTVDIGVDGEVRELPAAVDLCAFRIIQEALTNVVRHAGPTHADVHLDYRKDEVCVEIRDDGPPKDSKREPTIADHGGGHGLIGIRERAALFGGTVTACPSGRGFLVATSLRVADFHAITATTKDAAPSGRER